MAPKDVYTIVSETSDCVTFRDKGVFIGMTKLTILPQRWSWIIQAAQGNDKGT